MKSVDNKKTGPLKDPAFPVQSSYRPFREGINSSGLPSDFLLRLTLGRDDLVIAPAASVLF
jgi:hypothetical protein